MSNGRIISGKEVDARSASRPLSSAKPADGRRYLQFRFIPILDFGYDQFLLFDLVIDTEFSACHRYTSFVLQDLRYSLMSAACLRTFVSAKSNAFRIDFCVAVTA